MAKRQQSSCNSSADDNKLISGGGIRAGNIKYRISYSPIKIEEINRRNSQDQKKNTEIRGWNRTTERYKDQNLDPEILGSTVSPSVTGQNNAYNNESSGRNDQKTNILELLGNEKGSIGRDDDVHLKEYL